MLLSTTKKSKSSLKKIQTHFPQQVLWSLCPGITEAFWRFFYSEYCCFRFYGFILLQKPLQVTWCLCYALFSNPWCEMCSKYAEIWIGNVFSTTIKYRWKCDFEINAKIKWRTSPLLSLHFCLQFYPYINNLEGQISVNSISCWTLVVTSHIWSICYSGTVWWMW